MFLMLNDICIHFIIIDWTALNKHVPELLSLSWICLADKIKKNCRTEDNPYLNYRRF